MKLCLKKFNKVDIPDIKYGEGLNNNHRAWDNLLTLSGSDMMAFLTPSSREEWVEQSRRYPYIIRHAQDISRCLAGRFDAVYSYGVGSAWLEYLIKAQNPSLQMYCSDFTPQNIERLSRIFHEAQDVFVFDLLKDSWRQGDAKTLHLFHRLDPELSDAQWEQVFLRMRQADIRHIFFIPCGLLTWGQAVKQLLKRILARFDTRYRMTGYLRTSGALKALFSEYYRVEAEVPVGVYKGYLLTVK